eukprot:maker-scaffold_79-snap-gene-0.44-mRNA-1 protein AED:0.00 eAED:0.00 QI:218/1/1/1/0/0.5/2/150/358
MCLTLTGEVNKNICGAHGTCIDGECICDSGWTGLLDFTPEASGGDGAHQLFIDNFGNGNKTSFEDFKPILFKAAPCTGNIGLLKTLLIISIFVSLVCLVYSFYLPTRSERKFRILKITGISVSLIYIVLKLSFFEDAVYPYFLPTSLIIGFFLISMNSIINFYFYKYAKYHLEKARMMYSLKVRFYGVDVEKLFKYQVSFSFLFHVIVFPFSYFIPPIYLSLNKTETKFSFETMKTLTNIQVTNNLITFLVSFYFFLICQVVLGALLKDLKLLAEANTVYIQDKDFDEQNSTTISRGSGIHGLILRTRWSSYIISAWCLAGVITFLFVSIFSGGEFAISYFFHFQIGVSFPLVCILMH